MSFPDVPDTAIFSPREKSLLVIMEVAAKHGVEPIDIFARNRSQEIVRARHEVCWRLRRAGKSASHIGRFLRLNHTTVLYGIKRIEASHGAA